MNMMNLVVSKIVQKYGSLEAPNFSFVNEQHCQADLAWKNLRDYYNVTDSSDANNDVAYFLGVSNEKENWLVILSWVGPFCAIVKVEDSKYSFCFKKDEDSETEDKVFEVIQSAGFNILDRVTTFTKIRMNISTIEASEIEVYKAIYSDLDIFQWENNET